MQQPQSETVTLEAQRRLELCLTAANLGIWTYNIATDEFWASDRAKHLHGHQPHEVHTFAEAGTNIHPDDRDRAQAAIAQAIQAHSKLHLEYRVVWQDGSIHWIASDAEFIPSSEQGEGMFYGSVQDISDAVAAATQRKRIEDERQQVEEKLRESEERKSFLLKLSDALRSLADAVDIQETVTRTAMNYFGADRCYYCELEDGNAIIRRDAARGDLPTVAGVYPLSRFAILQAVVDAGRPFIVQDVHTTDTVDEEIRQLCIQLQVIAYINVPVIKNGKPVGVLCLVQSTPRDWTDLEVELAVETAERTWAAVERARAEEQLRRAAEMDAFRVKLSDALRSLSDAVEIQATVTRTTMNFFGADRCYYCEIIDGSAIIRRDASQADLPSVVGAYPLENSPIFRAMLATGQPFVFQDVHTTNVLDENLRQTCLQLQIIAGMNVPVIKQGEPVGILTITQSMPRNWTAFEMDLAEEIADRTWATIERTRAEANLREAELQRVREQSAREQEQQRAETLAELDRAKTLFFSNISHEFRTPLTLLLSPLQDALSDCANPLAPPHRERLELAHRSAIRLLKLVNTLLDFSRIEAGRMEAVYEPTDLARFTTELASVFRSAIERAELRLIVDCPPLPEPVYVDREMWEKIVLNLLSNAFKFTLEGEIAVRLHPADDHYVTLQVQDTGTGIPPEELPYVFERFYQVRRTKARTYEGSGIGLALVHELIRLHGGTVDVSSTVGQGSCFTIAIPLGKAHLPSDRLRLDVSDRITATRTLASTAIGAVPYVEEAERWLPPENAEFCPPSPPILGGTGVESSPILQETGVESPPIVREAEVQSPPIVREAEVQSPPELGDLGGEKDLRVHDTPARVLLVDDNADMREYLTRILSDRFQVEVVADGASALAAANERVPDLVLTDVMMPGLDGFELLKALRANPRTREIPIILLSARAGEESVVEGLEAGADDYLIKPFSAQELVSRVNGHLQMAQLRLEALYQERTLNRRKDELLSTVSHELNTPLVAILGWTRLLRANPHSQSMLMKSLETIERNATLQAKLIQDLLDMSRITAGKLRLNLEPVELKSVIENAIAAVKTAAIAKDIHLHLNISHPPSDEPTHQEMTEVFVLGDRDRLQQIITNLLTNAIKFTPNQGSITVKLSVIECENSFDASIAEISIADTGIGISAEFLPHVFDRFRQAQESNSFKGLGLGLAIARHLVELHGGTIQAESAGVNRGATFTINLPLLTNR